jgi:hypothetical protein
MGQSNFFAAWEETKSWLKCKKNPFVDEILCTTDIFELPGLLQSS